MSTQPSADKIAELRRAEIERLSRLPQFPSKLADEEKGVLLSDRIKRYCQDYKLIEPFDPERLLKPAGYDLTVGRNYSIRGEPGALNDGMRLEIEPYQVAIIETYETINMPEFLIGRWNIRVKLAYKGLLWVGEAQVDPGFRGHLCCPIYNLSEKTVPLDFREPLAMIDFVTTTPYREGECERFRWWKRKMLVFREYPPLNSGIQVKVEEFDKKIKEDEKKTEGTLAEARMSSEESFHRVQRRIDTFVTLVFTVVAVLFTGLGIVATKATNAPSFLSSPLLVAAVALFFALQAQVGMRREDAQTGKWYARLAPGVLAVVVITGLIVAASLFFEAYNAQAKFDSLQQQINVLQHPPSRK